MGKWKEAADRLRKSNEAWYERQKAELAEANRKIRLTCDSCESDLGATIHHECWHVVTCDACAKLEAEKKNAPN